MASKQLIPVIVEGVQYKSKSEAYKAYGANSIVVHNFMQKNNCTFEEALIYCRNDIRAKELQDRQKVKTEKFNVFTNKFSSLTDICIYYNIDYNKFNYLYRKHISEYGANRYKSGTRRTDIELIISYMLMCNNIGVEY